MRRFHFVSVALLATALFPSPIKAQQGRGATPASGSSAQAGEKSKGRLFALLIGINQYAHPPFKDNKLHYAVNDATALRDILTRSYGFQGVTVLTDADATREKILKALYALIDSNRIGDADSILIFFAGHGEPVHLGNDFYRGFLIPYDATMASPDAPDAAKVALPDEAKIASARQVNIMPYRASCLSMDDIKNLAFDTNACHVLLLADVCYSGLFTSNPGPTQNAGNLEASRQIITAGKAGETSSESPVYQHGVFTYALLEVLKSHVKEGKPFSTYKLYAELKEKVEALTAKTSPQHPSILDPFANGGEFQFAPTAVPPPDVQLTPTALPPPVASEIQMLDVEFRLYQDGNRRGSTIPFLNKYASTRFNAWLQEATKGNAIAELFVARCYQEGITAPKDDAAALKWAMLSANHGNRAGMNLIALFYENGGVVPQNHAEAVRWWEKAARLGNGLAMLNLGIMYDNKSSAEHDYARAMQCYRGSAASGYSEAMRLIGDLYKYGKGVPQDTVEALKWYRQAAEASDSYAKGLVMADLIGPAFKTYVAENATEQEKAAALQTISNALPDFNALDFTAANTALRDDTVTTAVGKMREDEKARPLLTLYNDMLDHYINVYQQASPDIRAEYIGAFVLVTIARIREWNYSSQYAKVAEFWQKSYNGLALATFTHGEKDDLVRQLNVCVNALLKAGNRKDGDQLLKDTLAICDTVLKDRPWDWYMRDAYTSLCFTTASTLTELGDSVTAQPLLHRGWAVTLKRFGQEDLLDRYAKLPLKGQIPDGASGDDAAFFQSFASNADKKTNKSAKKSEIERYTLSVYFGETKSLFYFYLVSGKNGFAELQDQLRWVKEYRGGVVEPKTLDILQGLNKIAVKNHFDFKEYCDRIFDPANSDTARKTIEYYKHELPCK